jgi:hypothetical protein
MRMTSKLAMRVALQTARSGLYSRELNAKAKRFDSLLSLSCSRGLESATYRQLFIYQSKCFDMSRGSPLMRLYASVLRTYAPVEVPVRLRGPRGNLLNGHGTPRKIIIFISFVRVKFTAKNGLEYSE